jgi:hypothetical protein
MRKCDFGHCTAWSGDCLSLLFGAVGAASIVVTLVTVYVYRCYGNCV